MKSTIIILCLFFPTLLCNYFNRNNKSNIVFGQVYTIFFRNFHLTANQDHLFKITIDRKVKGKTCTQGYIFVNKDPIGYTLELPDKDNENYVSSIPKGSYEAKIRTDGDKGWRIELLDVPNRKNIQIHVGNFTREIQGCILIGTKVDLDKCNVTNNYKHEAMKKLQDKFNEFTKELVLNQGSTNPINIEVEITGI